MSRFVVLLLALSACGAVDLSTVARLSALSPVEADPAGFAAALALPDGLDLRPGGATLRLGATRADTGQETGSTYVLERTDLDGADGVAAPEGANLSLYRVAPADLDRLRAQQATIRDWKADFPGTTGSLTIALDGCREGSGPAEDAVGAVYLRTEPDAPFLTLVRPSPLARVFDRDDISTLPACD